MKKSPGKAGYHRIDGGRTHTDSLMEAAFIRELVTKHGFSKRWRNNRRGVQYGAARYTPDVELSIDVDGVSKRALVEFKSDSATEFKPEARDRMRGAARHYGDVVLLLYVKRTDQWYELDQEMGKLEPRGLPKPGRLPINELADPVAVPTINRYGRTYRSRPAMMAASATLWLLETALSMVTGPTKKRKR